MTVATLLHAAPTAPCRPWPRRLLTTGAWRDLAAALPATPSLALLGLWSDTAQAHALFLDETQNEPLLVSTAIESGAYPALSPFRPAASWFERMVQDLWGHRAESGRDTRPWLDHGHWDSARPMAPRPVPRSGQAEPPEFLSVEGDGLHQLPLGPVRADIAESGHLRATCRGETVLRLELRLGYAHKGQMVLMRGKSPRAAARFAARLSGDTTVAHSLAFARAAEAALDVHIPSRAAVLRAIMLELERIANHLNDAGAICNAVSFRLASSRFLRHREALLRAAAAAFGHRLMMDCVVPGGVAGDIAAGGATAILHAMEALCAEWPDLLRLYDAHAGLADRMAGIGTVSPALAAQFASGGVIGRASGRRFDARTLPGAGPYAATGLAVPARQEGDVDARLRIRFEEIAESARLLTEFLDELPDGPLSAPLPMESGEGIGVAEGFRGDVWHWLRLDGGLIAACFPRDPSWLQWPLLETATEGGMVADLPLIERSFGCSISGVDL